MSSCCRRLRFGPDAEIHLNRPDVELIQHGQYFELAVQDHRRVGSWVILASAMTVLANVAVFISGAIVLITGYAVVDLIVGFAIGLYVFKESIEILREVNEAGGNG